MTGGISLRTRLGLGAALLGVGTFLTAGILWFGLQDVSRRIDAALASEARVSQYAALSQAAASFLVVSTEAVQTELPTAERLERLTAVAAQMRSRFDQIQRNVEEAVEAQRSAGVDAQSRQGTQSLGVARMEAMLEATLSGLGRDITDKAQLRAYIDNFASNLDIQLSQAVAAEVRFRNDTLNAIKAQRQRLSVIALVIAIATGLAVLAFYFGLIRPQFHRLEALRAAARKIGNADFAISIHDRGKDEIGQLSMETNRMAKALSDRQAEVEKEWEQLNYTIAQRTQDLQAANDRLAEVDSNRRRFFADVSHELRTPLTVILMEAQIGRKAGDNPAFATIEARAARLNRRIDDLLRVARSDSGQLALDIAPIPLPHLIHDVIEAVQAEIDNAGMELTHETPPEVLITCDANWIRQVLVSLIRNAVRHARSGTHIALGASPSEEALHISIVDNGPGIEEADQIQLFDRFKQGDIKPEDGFGIGLALVRWVIEEHGGKVSLVSPLPRSEALGDAPGTKVLVSLPFASQP